MESKINKTVISVVGIRPDFIRMSEIFCKLDKNFNHIIIHTGQHFNKNLSEIFFKDLKIREPDFNLSIGGKNKEHFHQISELNVKLIELIREKKIDPSLILFLGDSNSVLASVSLKKEGYKIGHIEAGMRSGDKRMLEEINRTVCDHCSDLLFVYHKNYKNNLIKEGISKESIYVTGNTIVEVIKKIKFQNRKKNNSVLLDIHRPENFKYKNRMLNLMNYCELCYKKYNMQVYMLDFPRTTEYIKTHGIETKNIKLIPLMNWTDYINTVYDSKFIISDSGTAQEESAFLSTPVIVPRDYTERPESVMNSCSFMIDINSSFNKTWNKSFDYLDNNHKKINTKWMGKGNTSDIILDIIKNQI